MKIFDKLRSVTSRGDNDKLSKKDLLKKKEKYERSLEICEFIIEWAEYHKENDSEKFCADRKDFIMYEEGGAMSESVIYFPSDIRSAYDNMANNFDPRSADTPP